MVRFLLMTLSFLVLGAVSVAAQGTLQGTVTEKESGLTAIGASVQVKKGGVLMTGAITDFNGNYSIPDLDAGTYDVEITYVGFANVRTEGVIIYNNKIVKLDAELVSDSEVLEDFIVIGYKVPLIEVDNTTGGKTVTAEEIANLPGKSIGSIVSTVAGVASSNGNVNIRGSRSNSTDYYVDGIRVSGSLPPQTEYEQIQVLTGGISAQYGDVTGGIISITTKGPQQNYSGNLDLETTTIFDNYNYNLASASIAGPIIKRDDKSILGFRVSAQYRGEDDNTPPFSPYYIATEEAIAEFEANPVTYYGNLVRASANTISDDQIQAIDYTPNAGVEDLFFTGKLDFRLSEAIDVTASGSYRTNSSRFLPGSGDGGNSKWILLNYLNTPMNDFTNYRANFRFRHRLGKSGLSAAGTEGSESVVQNITYVLQGAFERSNSQTYDARHGSNLFNYGYVGQFDYDYVPFFGAPFERENPGDYVFSQEHRGFTRTLVGYTPSDINPVYANFNAQVGEGASVEDYLLTNGFTTPGFEPSLEAFNGLHANVGAVYNSNGKSENDRITAQANVSLQIVPKKNSSNRHNIKFGAMYEQRTNRSWNINPVGLWRLADQFSNIHLDGVDTTNIVGEDTLFTGEIVPLYGTNVTPNPGTFYRKVRESLGVGLEEYVNVQGLTPDQLSIDMFSSDELTTNNILGYTGYNHVGEKVTTTFDDFFTATDAEGRRTFEVPAFTPNYFAFYVEDKFNIDDIYFSLGLRMDRYDANTKVAKDLYVLEDVYGADDFHAEFGGDAPSTVGGDAKVYVTSQEQPQVVAYRNGETWFTPSGTESTGAQIFGGQAVNPMYTNPDVGVTSIDFDPSTSFEDYVPQVNFSPRLAFSFAISDVANFYAHYDVMVQRPASNSAFSPLNYYLFYNSNLKNNPNLKPQRTIDYEVGFQQKLNERSSIKVSAYYRELRDMIQSRLLTQVATLGSYTTYDNLDFGTTKGFTFYYDLRRTKNIQMQLSYTLQFADGTGSNANSTRGLDFRGVQRALYPLSFDERHRFGLNLDYSYQGGKAYNGPTLFGRQIFANASANIQMNAVSGRPYTKKAIPTQFGGNFTLGSINGARLPWTFNLDARLMKNFTIDVSKEDNKNAKLNFQVYLRVSNILNRANIGSVYSATGAADDDGYILSANGQSNIGTIANDVSLTEQAYIAAYNWRMLVPSRFNAPRRFYLGTMFSF